MKLSCCLIPLAIMLAPTLSNAQTVDSASFAGAAIPTDDTSVIAELHSAARTRNSAAIGLLLNAAPDPRMPAAHSVSIVRRTVVACQWLCNENRYGDAIALAHAALVILQPIHETTLPEQAECLYWEAWLNAEVLGDRAQALALLKSAQADDPADARVRQYAERIARAVENFRR